MVTAKIPITGKSIEIWYDSEQGDWCYKGVKTPVLRFDSLTVGLANEIKAMKQIRANLNDCGTPETAEIARQISIAITNAEQAAMWLNAACIDAVNTVLIDE
jgi:hypothetical protein